jgi:hypothetical protein
MSTAPPSPSNTSNANRNVAPTLMPTLNTDYAKKVNVKKVPFDGTEASFYLRTHKFLLLLRHTIVGYIW